MTKVILMYLIDFLHLKTYILLSVLKEKLWLFIYFGRSLGSHVGSHLGGHFIFAHIDMTEIILIYLFELLIFENLYLPLHSLSYLP